MEQKKIDPNNGLRALIDELYARIALLGGTIVADSPWKKVGEIIEAIDETAGVAAGGAFGTVSPGGFGFGTGAKTISPGDVALSGGTAAGGPSLAGFGGVASIPGAIAFGGVSAPVASLAAGGDAVAFGGAQATATSAFAAGYFPGHVNVPSVASGVGSVAFGGGNASADTSFAFGEGAKAANVSSFAGPQGTANGINSTAILGIADGDNSVALCGGTTTALSTNSASIGVNTVNAAFGYKMGTDAPTATASGLVAVNADGAGTVQLTLGNNHVLDIENATLSATATGGAILPGDFVGYLDITLNGSPVKIPYYSP